MRIMLTGSPGIGKTAVAKALGKKLHYKAVNETEFALKKRIGKWDAEEEELIIPLQPFLIELKKELKKEKNIILEGHLLCELKLPVDFVVLLRCHPELLEAKLEAKGYSAEKVQDNVFCEGIDYCKKHVLRRYPAKKIIELHIKKTIKETMEQILVELRKAGGEVMNKPALMLLLLLLFAGNAFGIAVFERSLEAMGYIDFVVEGTGQGSCTEIPFVLPEDVNFLAEENYTIASLHLLLLPVQGKNFYAEVKLNDGNIGKFFTESFFCKESCWLRLPLPKEMLDSRENMLNVCLNNSATVTKSVLKNSSMIGIYHTADFAGEDAFLEKADRTELLIGEKVRITLILHNYGSASAFVEMKHARALAEDKAAYVIVDGNTQFKGFVKAGETIQISYTIKPRVLGAISLPPAALYYSNEFNEPQQKFAKMLTINVKEPERKVNAFVVKKSEVNRVGTTAEMQLAVKNEGRDPLFNLGIHLVLPRGITLTKEPSSLIDVLQPGETAYLDFSVIASQAGEYKIGCNITYIDLDATESKCERSRLLFEAAEVPIELVVALLLLAIAVAAYFYIQHEKPVEQKPKAEK